jgi:hypothetical protein
VSKRYTQKPAALAWVAAAAQPIWEGRQFFFEKKNQKTFGTADTLPASHAPTVKSPLLLFFRKEDFS